jgi:hypothetical protein
MTVAAMAHSPTYAHRLRMLRMPADLPTTRTGHIEEIPLSVHQLSPGRPARRHAPMQRLQQVQAVVRLLRTVTLVARCASNMQAVQGRQGPGPNLRRPVRGAPSTSARMQHLWSSGDVQQGAQGRTASRSRSRDGSNTRISLRAVQLGFGSMERRYRIVQTCRSTFGEK